SRGIPVNCVPLAVDRCIGHTAVAADERGAVVPGAVGAEVSERKVVEVQVAACVDGEFRVAAACTRREAEDPHLAYLGYPSHNPLEGLAASPGAPDPTRVRGKRAGDARVDTVRVRGVEPDILLEADTLDTADRRLPERGRSPASRPVAVCVKHGRGQGQT